jgi:hypothetical protein
MQPIVTTRRCFAERVSVLPLALLKVVSIVGIRNAGRIAV